MCDLERRPQLEYPGYSGKKILIQFRCIIFYHILYVLVFFNDQIYVYIKVYRPGGRVGEGGGGGGGGGLPYEKDNRYSSTQARNKILIQFRGIISYMFFSFKFFTTIGSMFISKCTDLGKGERTPI